MIEQWPFFRMYFDMLEMVLAKADVEITEYYEQRLVNEPSLKRLGKELRQRLDNLNKIVLHITDQQQLLEHAPLLYQTIMVRNPYIDPLHGLQAELLHRCRKEDKENKNVSSDINRALMVTMAGIAAGLRNTA
ncbi:unnamed protein product [Didymodactylos carnosus]|nr:unnamed protein product [Didymodactylos carnosus]CAF3758071.1 unnamed protein product [Didymodactylos carnosus]